MELKIIKDLQRTYIQRRACTNIISLF